MQRDSGERNPRIDDQRKKETDSMERSSGVEGRAEPGRLMEDSPERPLDGVDAVNARSTLAKSLDPSIFPADRAALLDNASSNYAYEGIIRALRELPEDRTFTNVQEVWEALGGPVEHRF
jgi:hypothetical protein